MPTNKTAFLDRLRQNLESEVNSVPEKKTCFAEIIKNIESIDEITAERLIKHLDLKTIKGITDEDGYFKEFVNTIVKNERESQTEIFYLLKGKQVSCLHSLDTTETWHWLDGKEISIFIFKAQGLEKINLSEKNPLHTIDKNTLFGAKITNLRDDNDYALVTCLCKPGFVPKHYCNPSKEEIYTLLKTYPEENQTIQELTPKISTTNKNIFQSIFKIFTCCIGVKKNEEQTPLINPSQTNR
ncbi:MAG: cupin domain-containing protein [Candidatus Rickettsiella isopodorum]|nr:cupin domain-containing protein [Candidatus Rickettsiella isopodorum]